MRNVHGILASKRIVKFVGVGVINTVVGCGLMFILFNVFGCSYEFSSFMNYAVGGTLGYFLNKYITFESRKKSVKEILWYILNIFVCYKVAYSVGALVVQYGVGWFVGCGLLPAVFLTPVWMDNIALLFSAGLYIVLNYLGQSILVFKPDEVVKCDSKVSS